MTAETDLPTSNRKAKKIADRKNAIANAIRPNAKANGLTVRQILEITKSKGSFSVDRYKWTQGKLRQKLWGMKEAGLLVGGRNHSGTLIYFLANKVTS